MDMILASWNIGEYVLLIINKSRMETYLKKVIGRDVSIASLLLWMLTVIGNVYLLLHTR